MKEKEEFNGTEKAFFEHRKPKSLDDAKKLKNSLKKISKKKNASVEDKRNFVQASIWYNFLLKEDKRKESRENVMKQEKLYRKEFWKFARKACTGTLESEDIKPTFDSTVANEFYKTKYEVNKEIDVISLEWYPKVEEPKVLWNTAEIVPRDIKEVLKMKNNTSAPGYDQIVYGFIKNLPSTHHILATLYNKIIKEECPQKYGQLEEQF